MYLKTENIKEFEKVSTLVPLSAQDAIEKWEHVVLVLKGPILQACVANVAVSGICHEPYPSASLLEASVYCQLLHKY